MFTEQTILTINVTCITFLVIMMLVMMIATRMKGRVGWAAMIIVTTTVPVYLSNTMRTLGADMFILSLYIAMLLNALCMPSLWLFVRSQLDKSFRFGFRDMLHFVPAIISLAINIAYYEQLSAAQIEEERLFLESGKENLPAIVNDVILFAQMFIYFSVIFRYIYLKKKYLKNNYADSNYYTIQWTSRFVTVFAALFFIVFVAYVINPRTDAWLIPILNVIAMGYLVYVVIFHSAQSYINRLPDSSGEKGSATSSLTMNDSEMKEICDRVVDYLKSSGAYTNPDLSLSMLAVETDFSPKNISRAINGYLKKNFFDLINEMRVNEAKKMLLNLSDNHTIDSVAEKCGFRSRSTFFATFKKIERKTPAQWMREN